jgi:hypothetical protein
MAHLVTDPHDQYDDDSDFPMTPDMWPPNHPLFWSTALLTAFGIYIFLKGLGF